LKLLELSEFGLALVLLILLVLLVLLGLPLELLALLLLVLLLELALRVLLGLPLELLPLLLELLKRELLFLALLLVPLWKLLPLGLLGLLKFLALFHLVRFLAHRCYVRIFCCNEVLITRQLLQIKLLLIKFLW
jgi:hypothetical protein